MEKRIFAILAVLTLCVSLAACGQKAPESAATDEAPGDAAVVPDNPMVVEESEDAFGEGNYRHQIGNCTFYTENDLDRWINGNEFDFYGMMDYFGWTERRASLPEDEFFVALWPNDGTHSDVVIHLDDTGGHYGYPAISGDFSGGAFFTIECKSESERVLVLPDGFTIPYSLCEILLCTLEHFDIDSSDDTIYMLNSMANDLEGYYVISTRIN